MRGYEGRGSEEPDGFFIVGQLEKHHIDAVRLGNEGQYIKMMGLQQFLQSEEVIPFVRARMHDYAVTHQLKI